MSFDWMVLVLMVEKDCMSYTIVCHRSGWWKFVFILEYQLFGNGRTIHGPDGKRHQRGKSHIFLVSVADHQLPEIYKCAWTVWPCDLITVQYIAITMNFGIPKKISHFHHVSLFCTISSASAEFLPFICLGNIIQKITLNSKQYCFINFLIKNGFYF